MVHLDVPSPPQGGRSRARMVGQAVVILLIWLGVNLLTFMTVSFLVFLALNASGLAISDTAFVYSLMCAIPAALATGSWIAGRRLLRLVRQR